MTLDTKLVEVSDEVLIRRKHRKSEKSCLTLLEILLNGKI